MASVSTPLASLTPKQKEDRLKLLESGAIADVTLRIPGKGDILAHRAILGPESDVLRELFAQQRYYDDHFVISLPPNTSRKTLEALVRFYYCGDYGSIALPLNDAVTFKKCTNRCMLHLEVNSLAIAYNIIPLCRHVEDQIARESKGYHHCGDLDRMLDWTTSLLDHTDAIIRQIGMGLLDGYLKHDALEYTSSDDFVEYVMETPHLNERLLTVLYAKAHASSDQM